MTRNEIKQEIIKRLKNLRRFSDYPAMGNVHPYTDWVEERYGEWCEWGEIREIIKYLEDESK